MKTTIDEDFKGVLFIHREIQFQITHLHLMVYYVNYL